MLCKNNRIEIPKLRKAALGKDCLKCGAPNSVGAHYSGIGSWRVGKGAGVKAHDFCIAQLCDSCHKEMDSYEAGNDYERAYEFLMLCMETIEKRWREGVIK